jgi:membrane protein implicated in regulation of membrane protease activity
MFADMTIPYQVWLLVGLAFVGADLAAPGLILSFLGLGCLLAAGAAYLAPASQPVVQAGVALAGALFGLLAIRPPLRRARKRRLERRAERQARDAAEREAQEEAMSFSTKRKATARAESAPDDPFAAAKPQAPKRRRDPFADLTPPKPPSRPATMPGGSQPLSILEEDDERSGFDLLEPVLDDALSLSIDEERHSPLLLTAAMEQPERPAPKKSRPQPDLDLTMSLDGERPHAPRDPVGRTARVLEPIGPFTSGEVEVDGARYKAFSDDNLKPGDKAHVRERMPDHPEILLLSSR